MGVGDRRPVPVPLDGEEYDEEPLDERADDELSDEEFVVHADDVFAGRAGRGLPRGAGSIPAGAGVDWP